MREREKFSCNNSVTDKRVALFPCLYQLVFIEQLRGASVTAGGFSVDDFLAIYSSKSASWLQHVAEIGSRTSSNHPTDPYRYFPIFPDVISRIHVALKRQNL